MSKVYNFGRFFASNTDILLSSIEILTPPTKLYYQAGEEFDSTGMIVAAHYSDGSSGIITGYTVSPTILAPSDKTVLVTYSDFFGSALAELEITVARIRVSVPYISGELTYDGETKTPILVGYDESKMVCSGALTGVNAGTYEIFFTPKEDYAWDDGSTEEKVISWKINRATVPFPTLISENLIYSGASQSPSWSGYDTDKMTISGVESGINAGSYDVIFTPTENYCWEDGSVSGKAASWEIGKAPGSISVNPTSLNITSNNPNSILSVTKLGNGAVIAVSSNTAIATVSVSGDSVTVIGIETGSCTITISTSDENYLEASTTVDVTMKKYVNIVNTVLVTESGTWRNPFDRALEVTARCFGGGGGGSQYGGGGGGGYMEVGTFTLSANESVSITIGEGGTNGVWPNGEAGVTQKAPTNGGTTSFGTYLSANGGGGGTYNGGDGGSGGGGFAVRVLSNTAPTRYCGGNASYGGGGGGGGGWCNPANGSSNSSGYFDGYPGGDGGDGGTYGGGGGGGGGSGTHNQWLNTSSLTGVAWGASGGSGGAKGTHGGAGGSGGKGSFYGNNGESGSHGANGTDTTSMSLDFTGDGSRGSAGWGGSSTTSTIGSYYCAGGGGGAGGSGGGGYGGDGGRGGNGADAKQESTLGVDAGGGGGGGGGGGYGASGGEGYVGILMSKTNRDGKSFGGGGGGGGGYGGSGLNGMIRCGGGGGGYGPDNYGCGGHDNVSYRSPAKSGIVVITYITQELT